MGIQINGQTDTVSSTTSGGKVTITPFNGNVGTGASISSPATNVLTLGTNNTESVRVDSSGNVGINTANPPDKLTVLGKIQVQQDSSSNNRIILRGQPSSSYRWSIDNYSSSNTFRIFREDDATSASGAVAIEINASTRNVSLYGGNLAFDAGKGIDFSATANSSGTMTSELLSDYEEGSWTPTISGSSSGTVTTGTNTGTYTRVGRIVTARFTFVNPNATTIGGTWRLTGLPFAIRQSSNEYIGGFVHYNRTINTAGNWLGLFQEASSAGLTYFRIMAHYMNGTESYDISGNVSSSLLFAGTVFYEAA